MFKPVLRKCNIQTLTHNPDPREQKKLEISVLNVRQDSTRTKKDGTPANPVRLGVHLLKGQSNAISVKRYYTNFKRLRDLWCRKLLKLQENANNVPANPVIWVMSSAQKNYNLYIFDSIFQSVILSYPCRQSHFIALTILDTHDLLLTKVVFILWWEPKYKRRITHRILLRGIIVPWLKNEISNRAWFSLQWYSVRWYSLIVLGSWIQFFVNSLLMRLLLYFYVYTVITMKGQYILMEHHTVFCAVR